MCFDAKLNLEKDKCNAWVINLFLDNKIFKKCAHLSCLDVHHSYPEVKPNNRCRTRLYTVLKLLNEHLVLFYYVAFWSCGCDTVRKLMHQTTQQVNKH
jgi:hypothetical protein